MHGYVTGAAAPVSSSGFEPVLRARGPDVASIPLQNVHASYALVLRPEG
jgi:hypothetical protein